MQLINFEFLIWETVANFNSNDYIEDPCFILVKLNEVIIEKKKQVDFEVEKLIASKVSNRRTGIIS